MKKLILIMVLGCAFFIRGHRRMNLMEMLNFMLNGSVVEILD